MTASVAYKLLAIVVAVALGWAAARLGWLGGRRLGPGDAGSAGDDGGDPARVLSAIAFYIFIPALLFRTTARIDLAALPWPTITAFFVPALAVQLAAHAVFTRQARCAAGADTPGAAAGVRAMSATFGNTTQVGIPVVAAVFGEAGLGIFVALISLHALVLLSSATALIEVALARASGRGSLARTLARTARHTVVHPVVLPVVAGLAWNATGWPLPGALDEALLLLAGGVVPLCLVLIGVSLAMHGLGPRGFDALAPVVLKLVLLPAVVFTTARWGFGLGGAALAIVTVMAALPTGANALILAQRYRVVQAETTGAVVLSTLAFGITLPLWLAVLARF